MASISPVGASNAGGSSAASGSSASGGSGADDADFNSMLEQEKQFSQKMQEQDMEQTETTKQLGVLENVAKANPSA